MGATIVAYDPEAMENVKKYVKDVNGLTFADDMYKMLEDADALFIATEWKIFRDADIEKIKSLLKTPAIFDGRNIFDPETMKKHGFYYASIGLSLIHI